MRFLVPDHSVNMEPLLTYILSAGRRSGLEDSFTLQADFFKAVICAPLVGVLWAMTSNCHLNMVPSGVSSLRLSRVRKLAEP